MNPIIYLSVFALLVCNVYGRAIDEPDNTIGGGSGGAAGVYAENKEWVKIKPIKIRPHSSNMVELECDAIGSPPPSIHWVRGGKAIDNVSSNKFTRSPPAVFHSIHIKMISICLH